MWVLIIPNSMWQNQNHVILVKIGNSLVPNLLRFVVVSEQCVKTVAEFKHHLILQNLINILSYLLKPNLTYCMLARPKRPTRA